MFTRFNRVWGSPGECFAITWGTPFGLPRDCSGIGKGLPWDCPEITDRFSSKRLAIAITEGLPLGIAKELPRANGLPVDCCGMQGCRLGIAQGYPWDCQ